MIPETEVQEIVEGHLRDLTAKRPAWADYENSYNGRFWRHHGLSMQHAGLPRATVLGGKGDPLPVKIEVNLLRPHVGRIVAQANNQSVRMQASAPVVWETRSGRPKDLPPQSAQAVSQITDDWMGDRDWQAVEQHLIRIATIFGSGALKISTRPPRMDSDGNPDPQDELTDRVVVDALPPWEALWDTFSPSPRQGRYIAHLRQQDEAWIAEKLGEHAAKDLEPQSLTDFLADGWSADEEKHRDKAYYWVLEFYDLTCHERRWFIGDGPAREGMNLREVLTEEMPYYRCTIAPCVVEPVPGQPMNGLSVVDGLFQKVVHRNILLTVAANSFMRDAARKRGVRTDLLKEQNTEALNDPYDGRWIEIEPDADGQMPSWDQVFHNIETPPLPTTFRDFASVLQLAQQEEQSTSPTQQGQQAKYATATETSLLAQFGEQNTAVVLSAIYRCRSQAAEDMLLVLSAEMEAAGKRSLMVQLGSKPLKVTREVLEIPWRMKPAEASMSPGRLAQTRAELSTAMPMLMELASVAWPVEPPPAQPGQPTPPGPPPTSDQTKVLARRLLDYAAQVYGLPEDIRTRAIDVAVEEAGSEAPEDDTAQAEEELMQLMQKMRVQPGPDAPFAVPDEQMPGIPGLVEGGEDAPASPPLPEL